MEQRNNLVLQGTETFSRGQLDNVALDGGALVLDSVAGRCLQYGMSAGTPLRPTTLWWRCAAGSMPAADGPAG